MRIVRRKPCRRWYGFVLRYTGSLCPGMHPGEPLLYRMLYLVTVRQQHFQQRVLCDHSKAHHIVTQIQTRTHFHAHTFTHTSMHIHTQWK